MNESTVNQMYNKVIESVTLHEPRVIVDTKNSHVHAIYEENTYHIKLVFMVRGLSENDRFAYDIKILNTKD